MKSSITDPATSYSDKDGGMMTVVTAVTTGFVAVVENLSRHSDTFTWSPKPQTPIPKPSQCEGPLMGYRRVLLDEGQPGDVCAPAEGLVVGVATTA